VPSLNNLAIRNDLIAFTEQALNTTHLRLLEASLWAKYAGAADYGQPLHYDYSNHSLVVPAPDRGYGILLMFFYSVFRLLVMPT
jgi:hypothetical protein